MKLIWGSDIHLNFLDEDARYGFYASVERLEGDHVLITGDIAESHNIVPLLEEMERAVGKPVHFVLGNHDFYGSSVADVKQSVSHLNWLPRNYGTPLSDTTMLLGVDGWGDCRNGDYENSHLTMSDWIHIRDLRKGYGQGMAPLKKQLQKLADADAQKLKRRVLKAIKEGVRKIIIATHVPPFEDVCLYAGKKSTPSGLPFFSSKILGTTILPIAEKYSWVDFIWLSGHTHSRAVYSPCQNLICKVAHADYFKPQIEGVLNV